MKKEKLSTRSEILDVFGWSDWRKVEKLRPAGLPVAKIGGRWEANRSALEAWRDKQIRAACGAA